MRKVLVLFVAIVLLAGCTKDKAVTEPCGFTIKLDWVKGSRAQFTVTPGNPGACYAYGIMAEEIYERLSEQEVIDIQLDWMRNRYETESGQKASVSSFADMFCYKGERTVRLTQLSAGTIRFLVFQMNPQTREVTGPLYNVKFEVPPVPKADMQFHIRCSGNKFTIIPSDMQRTWFWEYESEDKLRDVYGSPYFFYYSIIDMYLQYDFLQNLLEVGEAEWVLPQDDRSIKTNITYTMAVSGCADGEITSDVYYADFVYHQGMVQFIYSDMPVEYTQQ